VAEVEECPLVGQGVEDQLQHLVVLVVLRHTSRSAKAGVGWAFSPTASCWQFKTCIKQHLCRSGWHCCLAPAAASAV
jgi:hypothetical protein